MLPLAAASFSYFSPLHPKLGQNQGKREAKYEHKINGSERKRMKCTMSFLFSLLYAHGRGTLSRENFNEMRWHDCGGIVFPNSRLFFLFDDNKPFFPNVSDSCCMEQASPSLAILSDCFYYIFYNNIRYSIMIIPLI